MINSDDTDLSPHKGQGWKFLSSAKEVTKSDQIKGRYIAGIVSSKRNMLETSMLISNMPSWNIAHLSSSDKRVHCGRCRKYGAVESKKEIKTLFCRILDNCDPLTCNPISHRCLWIHREQRSPLLDALHAPKPKHCTTGHTVISVLCVMRRHMD